MQPIEIVDFKAEHYLADGKTIVVSFATKQSSARRSYALPVASLYSFIADLQKLQASGPAAQDKTPAPAASSRSSASPAPKGIEVIVPKRWLAKALPEHNLVLMMLNPQTEKQAAYAMPPKAVRDMAAGLIKAAEDLAKGSANKAAE